MDDKQHSEKSTAELIEKVKAEIRRKPTPQLIVLLRALEKTLEAEEKEREQENTCALLQCTKLWYY